MCVIKYFYSFYLAHNSITKWLNSAVAGVTPKVSMRPVGSIPPCPDIKPTYGSLEGVFPKIFQKTNFPYAGLDAKNPLKVIESEEIIQTFSSA